MGSSNFQADVCIIGGGLAGIVTALELMEKSTSLTVTIIEKGAPQDLGGLALQAFGGMALMGTPAQKRLNIDDSPARGLQDWESFAEFDKEDHLPRAWASYYCDHSNEKVYHWLKERGIGFLPAVQWVERGLHKVGAGPQGNSVPRYHVLWGTSHYMTTRLIDRLRPYELNGRLSILYHHTVDELEISGHAVTGCRGQNTQTSSSFTVSADRTVVATGGIGGKIQNVVDHWPAPWRDRGADAPSVILNGCHPNGDGHLHDLVEKAGGRVTHLDKMWNYAAGIPHPQAKFDGHGLSLIPTRTSLWCDHKGQRINKAGTAGKPPLITGFDTHYLCREVAAQEKPWTWHVMNWRIAARELAISGADHNPYIRDRRFFKFAFSMLTARPWLIKKMAAESDHIVVAETVADLAAKMNASTDDRHIDAGKLAAEIDAYDALLKAGPAGSDDQQIQMINELRQWSGDKIRTSNFLPILDKKSGPLVAIKTHLIARKTLGGIQTNLNSQVMDHTGTPIDGLFAVGEAAGFGGGGASGKRSLEGTFLPGCILTAQAAAQYLTR